jgi:large subunit ribosomal protein L31
MKKKIHPKKYRIVAFKDISGGDIFLCKSTVKTKENIKINGVNYPLYKMEISSFSHPFYTGNMKFVDTANRIEKFKKKYSNFNKKKIHK